MQQLLNEYEATRKQLKESLDNATDNREKEIIKSMLNNVEYIIKYMKLGYRPNERKGGVNKHNAYNLNFKGGDKYSTKLRYDKIPMPSEFFDKYFFTNDEYFVEEIDNELDLSFEDEKMLNKIISSLSDTQYEVFVTYFIEGNSISETAEYLNISYECAKKRIQRTKQKIGGLIK